MKLAYVAGPYRAATEAGVADNIRAAEAIARELFRAGFAVHCPHKNTAFMGGVVPDEVFLAADIEVLRRCDVVVTVPGWIRSRGAIGEVEFATANGIPVMQSVETAAAWLKEQGSER